MPTTHKDNIPFIGPVLPQFGVAVKSHVHDSTEGLRRQGTDRAIGKAFRTACRAIKPAIMHKGAIINENAHAIGGPVPLGEEQPKSRVLMAKFTKYSDVQKFKKRVQQILSAELAPQNVIDNVVSGDEANALFADNTFEKLNLDELK